MNEREEVYLRDMLDAAWKAREFVRGKTREALDEDNLLLGFAVVRALEIVGESARRISEETRATLPQFAWKDIIGMRTKLAHDYDKIDYDIVWQTATQSIPELTTELEKLFPDQTPE